MSSVTRKKDFKMEEIIKNIFYASVESVKPSQLITKKQFVKLYNENNREFLSVGCEKQEKIFDITGKKLQLGKIIFFKSSLIQQE